VTGPDRRLAALLFLLAAVVGGLVFGLLAAGVLALVLDGGAS